VIRARSRARSRAIARGALVLVRAPTARDRAEMVALRKKSRSHLARWEPRLPGGVDAFSAAYFDRLLETSRTERSQRFVVCRVEDGAIVGGVGLGDIARGPLQSCYIGYWLGADFTGHGYMTEAVCLVLGHAFTELRLHRVEANIIPSNEPSISVVRRCGFRREGYAVRYLKIDGRWQDHERWAITAEEWRTRARAAWSAEARDRAVGSAPIEAGTPRRRRRRSAGRASG